MKRCFYRCSWLCQLFLDDSSPPIAIRIQFNLSKNRLQWTNPDNLWSHQEESEADCFLSALVSSHAAIHNTLSQSWAFLLFRTVVVRLQTTICEICAILNDKHLKTRLKSYIFDVQGIFKKRKENSVGMHSDGMYLH